MTGQTSPQVNTQPLISAVHGVRYQVKDVARAVASYSTHLGFTVKHQQLPAFANVSLGQIDLFLSGPGASGSRRMSMQLDAPPAGSGLLVTVALPRVPDTRV